MKRTLIAYLIAGVGLAACSENPPPASDSPPAAESPPTTPIQPAQRLAVPMDLASGQYIPVFNYSVGPHAAGGSGIAAGFIDYLNLLNVRDGGINNVRLTYSECETQYRTERALACYQQMKDNGPTGAALFNPLSTGATYALLPLATQDQIPIVAIGYGRADMVDGRVFQYGFSLLASYWSQNSAIIRFIGQQEGGLDKLAGKTLVNLYHDSAFGRETRSILELQARRYGFQVRHIPVPLPGTQQQDSWLQIQRIQPAWIILRGWGVMTAIALRQAAQIGFPRERMVGTWWSGSEEDMIAAGAAAQGFFAAAMSPTGADFPALQQIREYLYAQGGGRLQDPRRLGTMLYKWGIIHGLISTEAIRTAQQEFGYTPLSGAQIRWGLERLKITSERLEQLGLAGLLPTPFALGCADHEGGVPVRFQQWTGDRWQSVSDRIEPDRALVRTLVERSAVAYARAEDITPRDCSIFR